MTSGTAGSERRGADGTGEAAAGDGAGDVARVVDRVHVDQRRETGVDRCDAVPAPLELTELRGPGGTDAHGHVAERVGVQPAQPEQPVPPVLGEAQDRVVLGACTDRPAGALEVAARE